MKNFLAHSEYVNKPSPFNNVKDEKGGERDVNEGYL